MGEWVSEWVNEWMQALVDARIYYGCMGKSMAVEVTDGWIKEFDEIS